MERGKQKHVHEGLRAVRRRMAGYDGERRLPFLPEDQDSTTETTEDTERHGGRWRLPILPESTIRLPILPESMIQLPILPESMIQLPILPEIE